MTFEESMRGAAKAAESAVRRTMKKYRDGLVTDEDDLTGVLVGNLDSQFNGTIAGISWSSSILRHRRGKAAEEAEIGADLLIHVNLKTRQRRYSKGVLVQSKRAEPHDVLATAGHKALQDQCKKMLAISAASFVFDYAKQGVRVGSATKIGGSDNRELFSECDWTSYRFFLELFRCPIGDPNIISGIVRDLPVPNVIQFTGSEGL